MTTLGEMEAKLRYPDLSKESLIAVDIETYDPRLGDLGPGVYRRDGTILGVGIAVKGFSEYYNLGHKGIEKAERDANILYLRDVLSLPVPKVGTRLMYDIDWLENFAKIKVQGKLHDIAVAEPLIDEYKRTYTLESMSQQYLGYGKTKSGPEQFCEERGLKGDFREHLYMMPYSLVREYVLGDVEQPLLILDKQLKIIEEEGLRRVYDMEMRLYRVLLKMRKNGIRIDRNARDVATEKLTGKMIEMEHAFEREYGEINSRSSKQLGELLDRLGVEYERNKDTGNPILDKEALEKIDHPVVKKIVALRQIKYMLGNYLTGSFLKNDVNGRIHCEFISMKQDEGGTVTGRLSAKNPNLQGVSTPDRDKTREEPYGKICRDLFLPEEGQWYGKIDYSQIEYRVITHFARGPKSEEMRVAYRNNPKTDFHNMAIKWAYDLTGTVLSRSKAKNLGFGSAYYMGIPAMMAHFGWTKEEAREMSRVYFEAFPFIDPTREGVVNVGKMRGYVRTPLGRRARVSEDIRRRHKEYIIFNHLIQGTAADILKQGMVNADEAGLFDILTPHITVHDELGISVPKTLQGVEAYEELKHTMENCLELKVPIVADAEIGPTWGSTIDVDFNELRKQVK